MANNYLTFSCLGFDIRKWPQAPLLGFDDDDWPVNNKAKREMMSLFQIKENNFGLLDVAPSLVSECIKFVASCSESKLILFLAPTPIARVCKNNSISDFDFLKYFELIGYDVCDLDGMFSLLYADYIVETRGVVSLIDCIEDALYFSSVINFLDKGHCPSSIVQVLAAK